jgi:hypothetical protein
MSRYLNLKLCIVLFAATLLVACKSIPEWDKEMIDRPVEDGKCPDLAGRFNYDHLGAKDTSEFDSILRNNLPSNLPSDRPTQGVFSKGHYASAAIYNQIFKGKSAPYPGRIIVTLNRLDKIGRKYHVRVDWDLEGLLGEYDTVFDETWICSIGHLFRSTKSTLHEDASPREIDPKDYRRIYVLPNGNIRIDRKHTFIPQYLKDQNELFRYYESRVFAKIP